MSLRYDLSVPGPIKNSHKLIAHYKGHEFPPKIETGSFVDFYAGYNNEAFSTDAKLKGSIKSYSDMTNEIILEWTENNQRSNLESHFTIGENDEKIKCNWELSTPIYADEKTFDVEAHYSTQDIFKIIHASIHSPESREITVGDVAFADLTNMKGSVNCSLPIFNLTWFDVNFDFDTQNGDSGKFIKATWPENYALLDSKSTFLHQNNHKEWKGIIKTELPLHSKHNIQIVYGLEVKIMITKETINIGDFNDKNEKINCNYPNFFLQEKPLITTGHATVEYNNKNFINSHYTCKTEKISENDSKDVINLTLENEMRPLGIYYTHQKKLVIEDKSDFVSENHL